MTEAPPPTIVLLDTSTLGDDIDLSPLSDLGALTSHPVTAPSETADRIRDAEIVLTNKVVLDRDILASAEKLRLICVCATGVNNIDLDAAREREIAVCNVSGYSTPSVAQLTISLLLGLATNLPRYAAELDQWAVSPIFCRLDHPTVELAGKNLGIAGVGSIGSAVGVAAEALGMNVRALGRDGNTEPTIHGWPRLPRDDFFAGSHAVSLHCPLTDDTRHLINSETLALMPRGAFLVNTGRGDLIDEPALAGALRSGHLGGAALDVLSAEPPPAGHPLLDPAVPNLIVTPHIAWTSLEARRRLLDGVVENIRAFLAGSPTNRVA